MNPAIEKQLLRSMAADNVLVKLRASLQLAKDNGLRRVIPRLRHAIKSAEGAARHHHLLHLRMVNRFVRKIP